jgi:hypothetical protein
MSDFILLNKHQKKALVIEFYKQGKTRRQIAEVVHMSFKDIADIINGYTGEDKKQVNKPEKSKDSRAFELFLQGKQSVEVAIELDMSADEVEELHVQYWRLSRDRIPWDCVSQASCLNSTSLSAKILYVSIIREHGGIPNET